MEGPSPKNLRSPHEVIMMKASLRSPGPRAALRAAALALGLTLYIELLNHRVLAEGLTPLLRFLRAHPWAFALNFLLILATLVPPLFLRRRTFACTLLGLVWFTAGSVNGFIRLKRATPFTAPDVSQARAGLETLPNYLPIWAIILLAAALLLLLGALVLLFLKGPKDPRPGKLRLRSGLLTLAAVGAALGLSWGAAARTNQISGVFANLAYAYSDYGFAYCFLETWLNRGVRRPVNYSARLMKGVASRIPEQQANRDPDVNLIFVQLESLLDPTEVEGLTLSGDAMPNLRRLAERCSSGHLTVPVVGASTANTEFEVLTGMSCRLFGPGEYPYKSRGKDMPIESAASDLAALGYTSHAIHNNRATFYDRNTVYANLGFDDYTSLEYMTDTEQTPNGWTKDGVLTAQILQALDSTEDASDFVFTVTVQCHGSYPSDTGSVGSAGLLTDAPEAAETEDGLRVLTCPDNLNENSLNYYVNELSETDAFVGDLIDALNKRGEPSIVVFYGDHLPALNLSAAQMESGTLFQTDYVIWDNLGLPKLDGDLTAYQLTAEVLRRADISAGPLFRFHPANKTASGCQRDLRALQYDLLYGRQYLYGILGQAAPERTELQLGISDIEISEVIPDEEEKCFFVLGQNFTPYCHVASGGKTLDTVYLTDGSLRVDADPAKVDLTDLSIQVIGKFHELLSEIDD